MHRLRRIILLKCIVANDWMHCVTCSVCWHAWRTGINKSSRVFLISHSVGAAFRIICQRLGCVLSFRLKHSMWSWDTFTGRPMFGDRSVSSGPISVQNKKESQHFCQPNKGLLSLRQRWINCTANPNSWLNSSLDKAWAAPHQSVLLDIRYRLLIYDW